MSALKHYAHMHKVKPGWLFLTGSVDDMETLRRKLGYVDPDPEVDKDRSNHIGVIKYGNEPLERWGGCPGMQSPEWIAETLSWVDWPKDMRSEDQSEWRCQMILLKWRVFKLVLLLADRSNNAEYREGANRDD